MTETKRVPELRFKADDGSEFPEWEEKKLGDSGSIRSGIGFPNQMQGKTGLPIPFIKVSDMNIPGNEIEIQESNHTVSYEDVSQMRAQVFSSPSILFAKVGAAVFLNRKRVIRKDFLIDGNMMALTPAEKESADFLYFMMQTIDLPKHAQVGALPSYNASDISRIPASLPSLPEQKKIAEFFSLLDERISKQADKVTSLREYKKGLSQRIFSRELRFKDDNGEDYPEWEEKKLGEVADLLRGGSLSKADLSATGNPCILYGELYTKYGEVIREVASKTDAAEKGAPGRRGDVIMPSSGESPWDIVTASALSVDSALLSGDMTIIRRKPDARYNSEFLARYINTPLKSVLAKKAQGASVTHLYSSDIAPALVSFPSLPEQEKIAALLSTMDSKIAKEEEKLAALREQKRGLMQRMFV